MRVHMTRRDAVVSEIRDRLTRTDWPRLTILIILSLAGGAAFLTSFTCLWAGVESMALRYAFASIVGYLSFVVLIRCWIAICRGDWDDAGGDLPNPFDGVDLAETGGRAAGRGCAETVKAFAGGDSGGGGGGANWMTEPVEKVTSTSVRQSTSVASDTGKGWDISIDLDEGFFFLVIAILAALGGVLCIGYVIYIAPVLLAEVALDAALVSAAYHRLRKEDVEHWTGAVLRRTLVPAAILVVFMFVAGFAAQRYAPEAHSIGGVIRALVS
jgi:hypothetical protein